MSESETFDGNFETVRLEREQSFGIPPMTYQKLAQAAISCSECAHVEPVEIQKLPDGEAGCIVTLFGRHSQYQIKIEVGLNRVSLLHLGLDSAGEASDELFVGKANLFDDWAVLVDRILKAEDAPRMTPEEIEAYDREWKAFYRKWSNSQ